MSKHTVEKIGGTSMSQFDKILKNIFFQPDNPYNRIFVVSAYGGITDLLLEHKKTGHHGVYQSFCQQNSDWEKALHHVGETMRSINHTLIPLRLDVAKADAFVDEHIQGVKNCLTNLRQLCSYGHFQLTTYLPMIREMLSSLGEAHSAFNTTEILKKHDINAVFIDLTGWKEKTNLPFDEKIRTSFHDIDFSTSLSIATGYVRCSEGIMTTYDRGYSEITFSKIATITGAKEGIIHKEYHLSTGDPKLIGKDRVKIIGNTNYDVADQLADLGMEAIHPRASKDMERHGIPIRIKNAFEPEHSGTVISTKGVTASPRVEMVTGRKGLLGVEIWDPDMVGQSGYDYRVLSCLSKEGISYIAKNTNANTITHYIAKKTPHLRRCIHALKKEFPAAKIREVDVTIVCAIGSNMKVPGFVAKASQALYEAGINILALDQCMRQVNMQFIVSEEDFDAAIITLHKCLVEDY